jgi:hypothetical protein
VVPHWTPFTQIPLLLIGLFYALRTGYAHARRLFPRPRQAVRAFAPVALLLTSIVVLFLSLYVG